jgi:hypothetical protein
MPRFFASTMRVSIIALALTALAACASTGKAAPDTSDKIHLFSEGYLQMAGATELTATRGAGGVWRVATVTGVPGNWSAPRVHRLDRSQAKALEVILDSPWSYVYEPAADPGGACLDPWSMRIEWSWRSKAHVIDQQCGPWGVGERVSQILLEGTR